VLKPAIASLLCLLKDERLTVDLMISAALRDILARMKAIKSQLIRDLAKKLFLATPIEINAVNFFK
jgi:hypothetical protein